MKKLILNTTNIVVRIELKNSKHVFLSNDNSSIELTDEEFDYAFNQIKWLSDLGYISIIQNLQSNEGENNTTDVLEQTTEENTEENTRRTRNGKKTKE